MGQYATCQKVSWKYFEKRGGGRQVSRTDPGKISNSQISISAKKGAEVEYFADFLCNVVLFDAFYHNYHVLMKNVLQI